MYHKRVYRGPIHPKRIRPFKIGDRAYLILGKNRFGPGTITEIIKQPGRDLYVKINYTKRLFRYYALWQLVPAELTVFAPRHMLHSFIYFIKSLAL